MPFHHFDDRGWSPHLSDRLRMRLLHFGGVILSDRWGGSDYCSPNWRVYCNLDDGANIRVGSRTWRLQAGHAWVIPAWLHWVGSTRSGVRHLNFTIDLPGLSRDALADCFTGPIHLVPGHPPFPELTAEITALGLELEGMTTPPRPAQHARGYALAYRAIASVLETLSAEAQARLVPNLPAGGIDDVLSFIEEHLDHELSNRELAALAHCGTQRLDRLFHDRLGTSPARYVRERRLAFACELLRVTDLPIETIADRSGFADRNYLSRVFAKHLGSGPAAWRKANQDPDG